MVFNTETFRTIKATYFRIALDFIETYNNDAVINGLTLDIHAEEQSAVYATLTGDRHRLGNVQTEVECKKENIRAVLLPIWIATFSYKGETLRLLVNGQTGLVGGEVPKDWTKIALLVGIVLLIGLIIGGLAQ